MSDKPDEQLDPDSNKKAKKKLWLDELYAGGMIAKSGTIIDAGFKDKGDDTTPPNKPETDTPPTAMLSIHDWMSIAFSSGEDVALAFKEEEHLRKKKGQEGGGQFVSTDVSGSVKTVKYGSLKVRYSHHERSRIEDPSAIVLDNLPHYKQHDQHSCGFVAALTAIHYFDKSISPIEVLKVVRSTKSGGINRRLLVKAFKQLGIQADYREDLTIPKLRKYIEDGKPVLVTIWPEDWSSDHWTTIRGVSDTRVYLANYKSLTHDDFRKEWFDKGEGLVCTKSSDGSSTGSKSEKPALSTDSHGHEHSAKDGRFVGRPSSQADADRQATRERKKLTHLKNQQQQARKKETVETLTAILKSAEETANKADEIADNFILDEQTSKKVKKPLRYAKAKARQQYNKLVEKYGVKGALAIWTAGQVIAWGVQIGLPLVGIPIIVPPGGGIATTAALGAMIDKYKKIRGKKDNDSAALSNPKGINQYTKHGPTVASHLFDINDSLDGPPIKEELLEAIRKGGWSDRDEMDVRMLIHAIDHHTLRGNNSVIPMEIHKTLSSVHARNSTHPHRRAIMKVAEHLGDAADNIAMSLDKRGRKHKGKGKGGGQYTKAGEEMVSHIFDLNDSLDGKPLPQEHLDAIGTSDEFHTGHLSHMKQILDDVDDASSKGQHAMLPIIVSTMYRARSGVKGMAQLAHMELEDHLTYAARNVLND